jgi:FHA domain
MQTDRSAHVTVLAPESHQNRRYLLGEDDLLVGRAEACDLRFEDPYLSRVHAKIEVRSGQVRIRDLGSSGGTWVNNAPVAGVVELHDGDVVALGQVRLRVSSDSSGTQVLPTLGPATAVAASSARVSDGVVPAVRYDVGDQRGHTINNIGRDQYTAYIHRRESFLREVAATRTKARWLLWIGFVVFVIGFGVQLAGSMDYLAEIKRLMEQGFGQSSGDGQPAFPSMNGFQAAFVGAAVSSVGVVLFVVGLVLHIVAASRRKRVERELPVHPWSNEY